MTGQIQIYYLCCLHKIIQRLKIIVPKSWIVTIFNENSNFTQNVIFNKAGNLTIYFKSIVKNYKNWEGSQPECQFSNQSFLVELTLGYLQDYKWGKIYPYPRKNVRIKWSDISETSTWTWKLDRSEIKFINVHFLAFVFLSRREDGGIYIWKYAWALKIIEISDTSKYTEHSACC